MAVRRPVRLSGSNLRSYSTADLLSLHKEGINQYGHNPSVTLQVISNGGNMNTITDTRYQASEPVIKTDGTYDTPDDTEAISVANKHVHMSHANIAEPQFTGTAWEDYSFPIYLTADNNIHIMDKFDWLDSCIAPCLDYLRSNEGVDDNALRAGTYHVSTSGSVTGSTLVSPTPIFVDTKADVTAFASGDLPELRDQQGSSTSYYLHRFDPTPISYNTPIVLQKSTQQLIAMPKPAFSDMLGTWLRYAAAVSGANQNKKLFYNFYNNSQAPTSTMDNRGSAILNTFTAAQTLRQFEDSSYGGGYGYNLYIAQHVPSGSQTADSANTWQLRIFHVNPSGNIPQ